MLWVFEALSIINAKRMLMKYVEGLGRFQHLFLPPWV